MGSKKKAPPAPDYTALAEKTAASQKEAANQTTLANRPNQVDIYGNTSTWTQDPSTGAWTQTQTLGSNNQAMYDANQAAQKGLMGQVTDALGRPLTTEGLPEYSNYDPSKLQGVNVGNLNGGLFNMDPIGNAKEIQDATYGLLKPQREMALNSEVQRLKNQGLTEDSPAFQRAMLRQGQADTDAQLKSLLAGYQEYGNQYARALAGDQSNFGQRLDSEKLAMALRGQQFGEQGVQAEMNANLRGQMLNEQQFLRQAPLQDLASLINLQGGADKTAFGSFMGAEPIKGIDYSGASQNAYNAQMGGVNAANQSKSGTTSALGSIAGAALVVF